jgi:DNA-binding response OmpR family regulator
MRSAHFALYNRLVRILVVEDETALAERLTTALKAADYAVDVANDGVRAEFLGRTETYDAAILDLGLPRMDGLTLLQRWRDAGVGTPVLVLTARASWHEKVLGIDEGADDYVTKPFSAPELLARMRSAMRRASVESTPAEPLIHTGDVEIDLPRRRVARAGQEVHLTPTEYDLVRVLAQQAGRVITHGHLLRQVMGRGYEDATGTLRVHVASLRKKLEADPSQPRIIVTEPGIGYRLHVD